jgi:hypothetical protein
MDFIGPHEPRSARSRGGPEPLLGNTGNLLTTIYYYYSLEALLLLLLLLLLASTCTNQNPVGTHRTL